MVAIVETAAFPDGLTNLRDVRGRARILARIERIRLAGRFGDFETVGEGVCELRVHFGPGYRVYFCRRGADVVTLLAGGDKASQARDIRAAQALAKDL